MSDRIETPRLLLRPLEAGDAESFIPMMMDGEFARFLTPDGKAQARPDAWRGFAMLLGHQTLRGYGFFAVVEKASGAIVGRVGPWMPEGWPGLECGWGVAPAYWGKGYASEAAAAAVGWMFQRFPDLPRVISLIDRRNARSQGVARKIGERNTGEVFRLWELKLDIWAVERAAFRMPAH